MNYCTNCGRSGEGKYCSYCGIDLYTEPEKFKENKVEFKEANIWLSILCVLCFLIGIFIYFNFRKQPESIIYLKMTQLSALIACVVVSIWFLFILFI